MLVLTRNVYERLMIGDDIILTVVEVYRDRVVIGIDAPKDVPVHREEVYQRIKRDGQQKPKGRMTTRSKGEND